MEGRKEADLPTDPGRIIKISILVLILTLGFFVVWASFAPLKQGAAAQGFVTVATYRKVVQHPYGGQIKEILVREGERVKKGQVLLRLEDKEIRARYANVKAEYLASLVIHARLLSERNLLPRILYPKEVLEFKEAPEIKKVIEAQEELFRARKEKHEAEKSIIDQSIKGLREYLSSLERQRLSYERQLEIIESQIESLKGLSEEGYYPKNRFLELQRIKEDLNAKIAETEANKERAKGQIDEYLMRKLAIEKEYLREIEAEFSDVEKRLIALKDSFRAVKDMLEKVEIRAPEDGMVMALRVHTIGAVIHPGSPILEIVPEKSELIVEAKLSPVHIEEVKKGQDADLRFYALDPKKTPVLEGVVTYVSPDIMVEEQTKQAYYLLHVSIKEESLKEIERLKKEITPGMPVSVVVKTGSRTFLSYLLKPFIDRLALSFLK